MNSNITIHIVEPGDITPVPDTGLFTHGVGGKEAAIITIFSLAIIASLFAIYYYHKKHKQAKKHSAIGLFILALLASLGTFTAFILNSSQSNISAVDLDEQSANLIVDAEDTEITVELDNEPVFAYVPVKVTVPKATESGYTLKAYSEHPTLSSDTTDKTIDLITIPEDGSENANTLTTALLNNTWGLSLEQPTSQDNQIYYSLPNNLDDAIVIKSIKDTTPANDETIVYYGFYITPDTPYGTYTGAVINYEAEMTMATVIYNGNGLYFNNNPEQTTNDVDYITGITEKTVKYSHTPNVNDEGEASGIVGYHGGDILNKVITIPGASKISIRLSYGGGYISGGYPAGFVSFWQGTHPDYTTENNIGTTVKTCGTSDVTDGKFYGDRNNENTIITTECELEGNAVTFAYWTSGGGPSSGAIYGYYATVTGYDADGNIIYLPGNTQVGGEYKDPSQDLPYIFLGWNEDKDATAGIYESKNDIELNLPLTNSETTELYAIWQHATKIHFDGNGADGGVGLPDRLVAAGQSTSLGNYNSNMGYQTAYTRDGYAFNGWNTKADGSGTYYQEYSGFTAPNESTELTLYAQWAPATTIIYDGNGGEGDQQRQNIRIGNTESIWGNWGYFSRDGYVFSHWNTQPDGSGTTYNEGQEFTAPDQPQTITLYAQWAPATTFVFNSNGGEGSKGNQTIWAGNTEGIYGNWGNFYRDGYTWASWNTKPDGSGETYYEGQEFTAPDQSQVITLYAQWSPATTITYDGNGADWGGMGKQTIYPGNTEELWNNDYHKNGYYFTGWNTESDGSGTPYNNFQSITATDQPTFITLYAQWLPEGEGYYTTITFDGNGADWGDVQDQIVAAGQAIRFSWNEYGKDGYSFSGWNTESDGTGISYTDNDLYTAINGDFANVVLYAQWEKYCDYNNICYKPNGADGETFMDNQWANSYEYTTLYPSNFSYSGHGFAGWSKDQNAAAKLTDDNPDNSPTIYGPNQTIFTENMGNGMNLYAVWLEPAKDINNNPLTFQTENLLTTTLSDNTTLASKPNGYVTALKDERDNQVYTVAKLADGNYWMIENLRLDNTAEITPENTNNPAMSYITGPGSDMVVRIKNNDGVYYDHLSPNNDNWCTDTSTDCIDQSYLNTDNTTSSEQQSYPGGNTYSYGNYYNWYSTTAGNGTYNTAYRNVGGDLCPSGWQLPIGGEANEPGSFSHLGGMLDGSDGLRSFPNNFVYSGYWYGSEVNNRGYSGSYWSSTALDTNSAYDLALNDYLNIDYSGKFYGYAVRCVAQTTTTIIYNGNGAESGDVPSQTVKAGRSTWLQSGNYYTKAGYKFAGWNTEPDGSGTAYAASSEFIGPDEPGTITLYAQWEEATTIIFDGNGADYYMGWGLEDRYLVAGETTQFCNSHKAQYYWDYYYTKNNHVFTGWNTEPDGSGTSYVDCAEFTAPVEPITLTLYAQWQPYTRISFNSNGGEGNRSDEFIEPGGSREFCNYGYFTKTNYYFYGWNTEPDGSGTSYSECEQFIAPTPSVDITLYAQWTSVAPNKISYNANGADGTTTMADQQLDSYREVTLWASNFSYSGHGFAGWSEDQDAAAKFLDNDPNNDPVIYGPNQNVNIDPNTGGMNLYAVWLEPAKDINNNPLTFQTENLLTTTLSDNTTLASKPNGYVTALKDSRDNQVYAVAKLADGNYWMIENLRLNNTAEITAENTNNLAPDFALSASSNSWCYGSSVGCINQSKINTDNTTNTVSTMNNTDANVYSYGNYYNWYSATAGNGTYNTTSGNVAGDLCPAGWQLPIGNETSENGSFSHLDVAMGGSGSYRGNNSAQWLSFPNNFVYSGGYYGQYNKPQQYRGTNGLYWSSTAYNGNAHVAYTLDFSSSGEIYPGTQNRSSFKRQGYFARCVAPINSATPATSSAFSDNSTDSNEAPSPEEPLGEYQSSTTTSTEGINIIIPILIATSTALGTSALVLLAYKSRHKEE